MNREKTEEFTREERKNKKWFYKLFWWMRKRSKGKQERFSQNIKTYIFRCEICVCVFFSGVKITHSSVWLKMMNPTHKIAFIDVSTKLIRNELWWIFQKPFSVEIQSIEWRMTSHRLNRLDFIACELNFINEKFLNTTKWQLTNSPLMIDEAPTSRTRCIMRNVSGHRKKYYSQWLFYIFFSFFYFKSFVWIFICGQ